MRKPRIYIRVLCVLQKAKRQTHFVYSYGVDPWDPYHVLERAFFRSICRSGLENTFGGKKMGPLLLKISSSRSFFRNMSWYIVIYTENVRKKHETSPKKTS